MKANVGSADRAVRIVAGLSIMVWGYMSQNLWGLVGLVPLLTGLFRWCPAYVPFKINSCAKKDQGLS